MPSGFTKDDVDRCRRISSADTPHRLKVGPRLTALDHEIGAHLAALGKAHEAYGAALHVTRPGEPATPTADVRKALDDVLACLREYAEAVHSTSRRKDPKTVARAERLLEPLTSWEGSARAGAAPAVAPAPVSDPNPPTS